MDERIAKLFADYGESFSALEMRRIAGLYSETFIAAGQKGTISQDRKTFLDNATGASASNRRSCCRPGRRGSARGTRW